MEDDKVTLESTMDFEESQISDSTDTKAQDQDTTTKKQKRKTPLPDPNTWFIEVRNVKNPVLLEELKIDFAKYFAIWNEQERAPSDPPVEYKFHGSDKVKVYLSETEKKRRQKIYRQGYQQKPSTIQKRQERERDPETIRKRKERDADPDVRARKKRLGKVKSLALRTIKENHNDFYRTVLEEVQPLLEKK